MAWIIELGPLFIVALYPIWSIYRLKQKGFSGRELVTKLFQPTQSWYDTPRFASSKNMDDEASSSSSSSSSDEGGSITKRSSVSSSSRSSSDVIMKPE